MNQRHAKWVEFLQNFTFVIKHPIGLANKVVDFLSRINLILQKFQISSFGFDEIMDMHESDANFEEAYEPYKNLLSVNTNH